ncbi:MAG: hypothetical protein K6E29_04810 [Cyanobacteria bacterium RUI128]|nr:hypothetical protein [Cyanobacteria bacterium RUI128]
MDIKKVQVTAFAIKNRMLGYQLLQNSKGSSPYQVKMIKTRSYISPELDRHDYYYTKSRDFSKPDEKVEKRTLIVDRLMFWKSKNDKKIVKEKFYSEQKANGEYSSASKQSELSADEIINRDTSYIDKEQRKGYHKELVPFLFIPVEHNVPTVESIKDREISKFYEKKHKEAQKNKHISFWTILKKNLSNAV